MILHFHSEASEDGFKTAKHVLRLLQNKRAARACVCINERFTGATLDHEGNLSSSPHNGAMEEKEIRVIGGISFNCYKLEVRGM